MEKRQNKKIISLYKYRKFTINIKNEKHMF